MSKINRKPYFLLAFFGIFLCFAAVNLAVKILGGNMLWDATSKQKYSLSPFSLAQIQKLENPLTITVYYSEELKTENPIYAHYAEFVLRFLGQYGKAGQGKILLTVINPEPYSQAEKKARQEGIIPLVSGDRYFYFGAVLADSSGKKAVIPSFNNQRDFWLEKDITSAILRFTAGKRQIVGLISPIQPMIEKKYGEEAKSYGFIQELTARFDVLMLSESIDIIPDNVEVLLLVAPAKMPVNLQYAVDQYIMRGGKLILLADKVIEQPDYQVSSETIASLNKLMKNWGIELTDIVGSRILGEKMFLENHGGGAVSYPLWLNLTNRNFNHQSPYMADLNKIRLHSPIAISEVEHDADVLVTPLISADDLGIYTDMSVVTDKSRAVREYPETNSKAMLAVLSEGKYRSAFKSAPDNGAKQQQEYLYYSNRPTQILVVGDSDMIRDDVWFTNDTLNDNGQFLLRAIELMSNHEDAAKLYKTAFASQSGFGKVLYDRVYALFADKIGNAQNQLQTLLQKQRDLLTVLSAQKQVADIQTIQTLNETKDKIETLQNELKQYEYQIRQKYEDAQNLIIFVNVIAIPLVILLIWCGCYVFLNRHRRKSLEKEFQDAK